ncbi:MAG: helix-turn-helix domain-containing protein [Ruminococcaceae bacterium]|nr:helix-turn-helix domain-containing protein [Oscillospiraceae bacterium]
MTLRELRKQKKMTQVECARYLGIPIRTYQNYETDVSKSNSMKYAFMMQKLREYGIVDEMHGILSIQQITDICKEVFSEFDIEYCYLFGSYAKGKANEESDIDLLISTPITGMRFYDLVEALRDGLKKRVDVLSSEQLKENIDLTNEILKDGVKIYG